jgi:cytochrome c peroxidase
MTKIFLLVVFATSMLFSNSSYSAIPANKIDDEKKYNLGKELFFDPNLSSTKTISCASCHLFSKVSPNFSSMIDIYF